MRSFLRNQPTIRERLQAELTREKIKLNLMAAFAGAAPSIRDEGITEASFTPVRDNTDALIKFICFYAILTTTIPEAEHYGTQFLKAGYRLKDRLSKRYAQDHFPRPSEFYHPAMRS